MFKKIRTPYGGELEEIMTTPDIPIDQTDSEIQIRKVEAQESLKRRLDQEHSRIETKSKPKATSFFASLKQDWNDAIEAIAKEMNRDK